MFLVAEIGVNWDGDLDVAKQMMHMAKDTGCNAIKFQAFDEKLVKTHPERARLIKSAINKTNIESINQLAKSVGIEWFCTPMYPEAVDMLDPFVSRFKIRVADGRPLLKNETSKLLECVLKTNKEIIVSSEMSPKNSKYYKNSRINWLYSVPKYPCSFSDLYFGNISDFDGYSNHCPHFLAPLAAVVLGAKIIEVHITLDKSKNFVDNPVSFDNTQLKELMDLIRLWQETSN